MVTKYFVLGLTCAAVAALGQEMVAVNILTLYERVPLPPASVQEAYTRHECKEENMNLLCTVDKFYAPIVSEQNALAQQLEKLSLVLNTPAPAALQQMDAAALEKKMATMSTAEKMQFAMAMAQQMGLGAHALTPESEDVIAAQEEYGRLNEQLALDLQNGAARNQKQTDLKLMRERKHAEVNTWFEGELKKIPLVVFGEAGRFPEPKAEYALKQAAVEKHFAVENEYLQALRKLWLEESNYLKTLYTPFQQKLAAIHYGEDAANVETKRNLVGGQTWMLGSVEALVQLSRSATEEAMMWWRNRLETEKQKPRD